MFAGFLLTFGTTFANVLCFLIDFPHMLCFLNNSYQFTFLYCVSFFYFCTFSKSLLRGLMGIRLDAELPLALDGNFGRSVLGRIDADRKELVEISRMHDMELPQNSEFQQEVSPTNLSSILIFEVCLNKLISLLFDARRRNSNVYCLPEIRAGKIRIS